jgi:hypothetical protein
MRVLPGSGSFASDKLTSKLRFVLKKQDSVYNEADLVSGYVTA